MILLQAQQSAAACTYWQKSLWDSFPNPTDHSAASIRRWVRYNALLAPFATSLLTAHPAAISRVHNAMWAAMLCRTLDAHFTQDFVSPFRGAHCSKLMETTGDHATICSHGFGAVDSHNTLRNVFARQCVSRSGSGLLPRGPVPHTEHRCQTRWHTIPALAAFCWSAPTKANSIAYRGWQPVL